MTLSCMQRGGFYYYLYELDQHHQIIIIIPRHLVLNDFTTMILKCLQSQVHLDWLVTVSGESWFCKFTERLASRILNRPDWEKNIQGNIKCITSIRDGLHLQMFTYQTVRTKWSTITT